MAIGFCVVVGGFAAGNVSGGALNPAVSAALALSGGGMGNAICDPALSRFLGTLPSKNGGFLKWGNGGTAKWMVYTC